MACLFFISKITIDYLTASLNFLPVCGFLPILAALFLDSKVPKPTRVTLSPFLTADWIASIVADKTSEASFLVNRSALLSRLYLLIYHLLFA